MNRLVLLALLVCGCGEAHAPELGTTEPVDAGAVVQVDAAPDVEPVDPCAHPDCEHGGQVSLGDGMVIVCQCPKAGR